jgi:hypothetical protein
MLMLRLTVFSIILVTFLAITSLAFATVSCHCFQDRTFDPSRPSASDAYFLATIQNSLIASALNVSKRSIVQAKMGGADADLLWVTYYLSDRTGLDVADLIEIWTSTGLNGLLTKSDKISLKLDKPFLVKINPSAELSDLADGAYRSVMIVQLGIDQATLDRLEMTKANRKEQVMAIFISLLLAEDPADIYQSVKMGKKTWSQVLATTGLDPQQIEPSWSKLLKVQGAGL